MMPRNSLLLASAATLLALSLSPTVQPTAAQGKPSATLGTGALGARRADGGRARHGEAGRQHHRDHRRQRRRRHLQLSSGRLQPGRHEIRIRATGYVIPAATVEVPPGGAARSTLTLRPANVLELALQLTDPEWLASYPLDDETKFDLFRDCSRCHIVAAAVDVHLQRRAAGVGDEADGLFGGQFADDVPAAERAADGRTGAAPNGASRRRCTVSQAKPWPRSI